MSMYALTLDLSEDRCQGRTAYSMGQPTLCGECTDCLRRTDIPPGVTVSWMQPPVLTGWALFFGGCPARKTQEDEVVPG